MATTNLQTHLDAGGVSRLLNLRDAVDPQEPATKAQLDAVTEGLNWKEEVRAMTVSNINLASPGATIDTVMMAALDRVLVRAQTDASQNGLYVWNGAATPMTRTTDADTMDKLRVAVVSVAEGSGSTPGSTWKQETIGGAIGSVDVVWGSFGTSAPPASESTAGLTRYASNAEFNGGLADNRAATPANLAQWPGRALRAGDDFGDGVELEYTITHGFNTRDVSVDIFETASPYRRVLAEVAATSTSAVTVRFNTAPATDSLRAVIKA